MIDVFGIILADEKHAKLQELTTYRSLAAVPVAARYRVVDFVLSNMVNSGIVKVGIATEENYQSLMDHVGTGKPWDLNRKNNGLFLLPPYANKESKGRAQGTIDALRNLSDFLKRSTQKYVVITGTNIICTIDYEDVLKQHIEKDADITVVYKTLEDATPEDMANNVVFTLDNNQRVRDVQVGIENVNSKNVSLEMYIMENSLLKSLIDDSVSHGEHDFVMDVLIKNLSELYVNGYKFEGYTKRIKDVKSYFDFNMDVLSPQVRFEIFGKDNNVYTKVKDQVPTKYNDAAVVRNSIIADGCVIDGTVINSVLFRGVKVKAGTVIKNSIIMENTEINENCALENVILDKDVIIRSDRKLISTENYPIIIGKFNVV